MTGGRPVTTGMRGYQAGGPQFVRITQLLRLPASQRHQPGFRLGGDDGCRSPIETSPASPIEMSRSSIRLRLVEVAWNGGDHDEPQRADTPAGADRRR